MDAIYEMLSNAPAVNDIIPDSCLSFYEESLYVAEFVANETNIMMENIGVEELREYELTESLMIYEGENAKALTEKIKSITEKLFGAIKKLFSNINEYFKSKIDNAKKFADVTPAMINMIPEGKDLGVTHVFFDYKSIKFAQNTVKFCKQIDAKFKASSGKNTKDIKDMVSSIEGNMISSITGVDADKISGMKSTMRKELLGDTVKVDKAYLKRNIKKILKVVTGDEIPNAIKAAYNAEKNALASILNTVDSVDESSYKNIIPIWTKLITRSVSVANAAYSIAFDVYKRMHREYCNILLKAKKATGSKAVKESLNVEICNDLISGVNTDNLEDHDIDDVDAMTGKDNVNEAGDPPTPDSAEKEAEEQAKRDQSNSNNNNNNEDDTDDVDTINKEAYSIQYEMVDRLFAN